MINLLSPASKSSIKAARRNVQLRTYTILSAVILIATLSVYGVGFYLIAHDKAMAETQLANDKAAAKTYAEVLDKAKTYKSSLLIAKKVLASGMNYSDFLTSTAAALPAGTVLTSFALSNLGTTNTLKPGGVVLQARTTSYGNALLLKEALESSALFDNVNLSLVSHEETGETASELVKKYPYNVTINVTISPQKAVL